MRRKTKITGLLQNRDRGRKGGVSMWTASAAGAALGAALGGMAGVALVNNTTRRLLRNTIDQASQIASETVDTLQSNRMVERATRQLRGRKGGRSSRRKTAS